MILVVIVTNSIRFSVSKSLRGDFPQHTRRRTLRNPAEALLFLVLILSRKTADGKERADRLQPPGLRPKKRRRQSNSKHMFCSIPVHVSPVSYFFCFQSFSFLSRILSIIFLPVQYLTCVLPTHKNLLDESDCSLSALDGCILE